MDKYKLDETGTCKSCKSVPVQDEELKCFLCQHVFHGTCSPPEEKVGTKGLISQFNKPSTKGNFLFLCDKCLTEFEMNKAKTENDRLNTVEKSISLVSTEPIKT